MKEKYWLIGAGVSLPKANLKGQRNKALSVKLQFPG